MSKVTDKYTCAGEGSGERSGKRAGAPAGEHAAGRAEGSAGGQAMGCAGPRAKGDADGRAGRRAEKRNGGCAEYAGEAVEPVAPGAANVRFDERGLVPCVVQQEGTGEVLMVAWMSEESLRLTLETGTTWFWSRSRRELWNKGATSGNVQRVRRLLVDCDADTLLAIVDSPGPACHTGHRSCFYRELAPGEGDGVGASR